MPGQVVGLSPWRTGFNAGPFPLGFVVQKMAVGQVLLGVFWFYTVSIIPGDILVHSSITGAV